MRSIRRWALGPVALLAAAVVVPLVVYSPILGEWFFVVFAGLPGMIWLLLRRVVARPRQLTITREGVSIGRAAGAGPATFTPWAEVAVAYESAARSNYELGLQLAGGRQLHLAQAWPYGPSDSLAQVSRHLKRRLRQQARPAPAVSAP